MGDICGDNRFEVIAKAKEHLLKSTNIHTSDDEMKVIDSFLFRCWQMGWLERYDKPREPLDIPTMSTDFIKEYGLPCPKGYIFKDEKGNVINATKIVLEKKKKEYPKTYEECEKILGLEDSIIEGCLGYEYKLLNAFQKLRMCRDAYWKIAGKEMGLGKPWEPDYTNPDIDLYVIINIYNRVEKAKYGYGFQHCTFSFPTSEMRDAFYENFKEEIEQCKELL